MGPRLRECRRQAQVEVISNSRNKIYLSPVDQRAERLRIIPVDAKISDRADTAFPPFFSPMPKLPINLQGKSPLSLLCRLKILLLSFGPKAPECENPHRGRERYVIRRLISRLVSFLGSLLIREAALTNFALFSRFNGVSGPAMCYEPA